MKNLFSLFVAAGVALSMTACLNDDEHYTDFKNVGAIAEIPSTAYASPGVVQNRSYLQVAAVVDSFDVNIASPNPPTEDIQVTLAVDEAALKAYNTANDTQYSLLPASLFQLTTPTVTVKAGQRLASVKYQLNTTALKFTDSYALPISIKSASNGVTVSGNYATKVIAVVLRNPYEANYLATGQFTHPNPAVSRPIKKEKSLTSIDATTSETEFADLGGSGWLMWLRINPDNTVTIIPKGATNAQANPNGVNKYDPATKTFTLNYKYPGGGGDRIISETLKRE